MLRRKRRLYSNNIEYAEKHLPEGISTSEADVKMKVADPGLFFKASSRPDLAALVCTESDRAGGMTDTDILFADIKNSDKYSADDSVEQEIAYLMLLQYWWKVFCGREVDDVYGFALCGPRCSDLKKSRKRKRGLWNNLLVKCTPDDEHHDGNRYAVALIKLSAPKTLGDLNVATIYREDYSLVDDTGLRLLCRFLSSQQVWNRIKQKTTIVTPCPAWLIAPVGFGRRIMQEPGDLGSWSMVPNGTFSLVFNCTGSQGVYSVLEMVEKETAEQIKRKWKHFLDQNDDEGNYWYVKVRTKATYRGFNVDPIVLNSRAREGNSEDILETYPDSPVFWKETSCVVLMNDRGNMISQATFELVSVRFNQKFRSFWETTVASSKQTEGVRAYWLGLGKNDAKAKVYRGKLGSQVAAQ